MDVEINGTSQDARKWAMFCHLASLLGLTGIPFANVLGPVIVWMMKREEDPFIDQAGKEAVNFQISMTIYIIVAALLILLVIGLILLPLIGLADLIFTIIAAIKSNDGEEYRYPLTIRFLK